jgi:hypothetical protein
MFVSYLAKLLAKLQRRAQVGITRIEILRWRNPKQVLNDLTTRILIETVLGKNVAIKPVFHNFTIQFKNKDKNTHNTLKKITSCSNFCQK